MKFNFANRFTSSSGYTSLSEVVTFMNEDILSVIHFLRKKAKIRKDIKRLDLSQNVVSMKMIFKDLFRVGQNYNPQLNRIVNWYSQILFKIVFRNIF